MCPINVAKVTQVSNFLGSIIYHDILKCNCGQYAAPETTEARSNCCILQQKMECELRQAKSQSLRCGEVLLPPDLLAKIAADLLRMAESEPYGIRGCVLVINYEDMDMCQRIGEVRCDPGTAATFEVYLTLKHDVSSWTNRLPNFLRGLTKSDTIVMSPGYTLAKKKLYRSFQQ